MIRPLTKLAIIALALSFGTMAYGQASDWYVTGSAVYNDLDDDRRLDEGVNGIQIGAGWDFTDWLTLEGKLIYSSVDGYYRVPPGPYEYGNDTQLDLSANILAYYNRDAVIAPYAVLGIGYQDANLNYGGKESNPTAAIGAGFRWQLGVSPFSIRTEVNMRRTFDGGEDRNFDDYTVSLGVEYRFGKKSRDLGIPSDKPADTDGDGVLDMWDECPDTPAGVSVTSRGCEIQRIEDDNDNDRVPNSRDDCPNTPAGSPVDPRGCSLDSDMDGVPTDRDRCPGSRPGADVNEFGCENDNDNDKVADHHDRCLDTRPGVKVDVYGCEIRDIISLPGVNFQTGSDLLAPGAEDLIEIAAQTLNQNPSILIEVAGHTDSQGNDVNNLGLSDRRAKTVYDYLFLYGVDPDRMTFKGYGESEPIADNSTAEGRAINRRVELRVTRN